MSKAIMGARVPPMFEVGESYSINWLDGGQDSHSVFDVASWEAPLLKVQQGGRVTIFNTASSAFVAARPYRPGSGYNLDAV